MLNYRLTHPHSKAAVWLAWRLDGAPSEVITRALALSECPRRLFVLAATLRKSTAAAKQ